MKDGTWRDGEYLGPVMQYLEARLMSLVFVADLRASKRKLGES